MFAYNGLCHIVGGFQKKTTNFEGAQIVDVINEASYETLRLPFGLMGNHRAATLEKGIFIVR